MVLVGALPYKDELHQDPLVVAVYNRLSDYTTPFPPPPKKKRINKFVRAKT